MTWRLKERNSRRRRYRIPYCLLISHDGYSDAYDFGDTERADKVMPPNKSFQPTSHPLRAWDAAALRR